PVLCLLDDAQWLDLVSVVVLGFIARRLYADRVGVGFTVREGEDRAAALVWLPALRICGVSEHAAGEQLGTFVSAPVVGGGRWQTWLRWWRRPGNCPLTSCRGRCS